ncbi:MAG TPA: acetylxylan esterase [Verrucomicrobiae bacterium]
MTIIVYPKTYRSAIFLCIAMTSMRSHVVAAGLLLVAVSCFGQFVCQQRNSNGLYAAGEKAVWTIKPSADYQASNATYTVCQNGTSRVVQQGTLDFSAGSATIEAGLDEPGALVLELTPAPGWRTNVTTTNAGPRFRHEQTRDGAIIDAAHLKPSLSRPEDFDSWWQQKLLELDSVPANAQLEPIDAHVSGVEYFKVTLDNVRGAHVRGQLAKPGKEGKFPALLQFQYAGVYPLKRQWVTDRAKAGWLALNICAHDMPFDDENEVQRLADGPLKNYQAIGNTNRESSYFLKMYLGDCQALKYLVSRPDWDGKTLVVVGDSMGGQQSFATVGLIGEQCHVTAMSVHMPAGADVGAASMGRRVGYPNWPSRPDIIETARYFDSCNFAPRIKVPCLVAEGLYDTIAPPIGGIAAYNLIAGPKELLTVHSDHMAGDMQASYARRNVWLSALIKGEAPPLKK